METRTYECQYCRKEYVPKRRGVQKFCSDSCRVRTHQLKSKKPKGEEITIANNIKTGKNKIEQMSFAGVGNAAAAMFGVNIITDLMTKFENKQATKQDISQLKLELSQLNFKMDELIEMRKKNENGSIFGFKSN
ncbi:hypothetical protein K8354_13215 [Polaribacter litorisediminis]|uniref:hypothetical protein n=1 Tax=Polaribacter litorisediminis TaxID=1908341 RepID=UPI001CBF3034|nr:hypothetical protein [Polaribacter litorisediminis]UAM97273.1 hypothetical protein K8354_13215 [Polaribacter litorisediminis]